jgi:hypothetical protein
VRSSLVRGISLRYLRVRLVAGGIFKPVEMGFEGRPGTFRGGIDERGSFEVVEALAGMVGRADGPDDVLSVRKRRCEQRIDPGADGLVVGLGVDVVLGRGYFQFERAHSALRKKTSPRSTLRRRVSSGI